MNTQDPKHLLAQLAKKLQSEGRAKAQATQKAQQLARQQACYLQEQAVFLQAMTDVKPLKTSHQQRYHYKPEAPQPIAQQFYLDESQALHDSLSDDFTPETLMQTDEQLSYAQDGIGQDVLKKLRLGHWHIQGQIDLHGLRRDDARVALNQFIHQAHAQGWRCVRVVHGKGHGSALKMSVLKPMTVKWLIQMVKVMAFVQARPMDGGAGALIVLLSKNQ